MTPNISIVGTGYVGLSTATGFATKGYKTIASTHNPEKAASINQGIPPFHEPGLQERLLEAVEKGRLKCVVTREEAVLKAHFCPVEVSSPFFIIVRFPTLTLGLSIVHVCKCGKRGWTDGSAKGLCIQNVYIYAGDWYGKGGYISIFRAVGEEDG